MREIVFLVDGWFMRKQVYKLKAFYYCGKNIREYCQQFIKESDYLYRIFYYDTEPLLKKGHNPISKNLIDFKKTAVAKQQFDLFDSIKKTPHMALRLGKSVWENNEWIVNYKKFKEIVDGKKQITDLNPSDVRPRIKQKAVDMKIGLDIAHIAIKKLARTLIIITGDADIVPALKLARREGLQVGLDPLRCPIQPELSEHVDFINSFIKPSMFK